MNRFIAVALSTTLLVGLVPLAGAQNAPKASGLETSSSPDGPWVQGAFVAGKWIRCTDPQGEVINFSPKASVRIAEGTVVKVSVSKAKTRIQLSDGRLYCRLGDGQDSAVEIDSGKDKIRARSGDFVVQNNGELQLHVFSGDATDVNSRDQQPKQPAATYDFWTTERLPLTVASDGSDTRKRDSSPDEYSRLRSRVKGVGKEKKKKPVATPSPVSTPSEPPQPPQTNNSVNTAGQDDVTEESIGGGGGGAPYYLLGAAGLGGLTYLLVHNNDSNNGATGQPASL